MKRVHELIEGIVQRSDFSTNSGHPLWRWRVRDDELMALQQALTREMPRETHTNVVCAGFCLFAAHYFCRHYEGGPWAWETIIDPLGWSPSAARLYLIVRKGLAYWGRNVMRLGGSYEYLVTLICEGGLPLRVIAAPDNQGRVRRWFREVLRVAERFDMPAARAALELDELLPVMLRNDLVRDTGAELIDRVISLRREVGNVDDPASRLDQLRPGWRQELPLEVEDSVAREFINGLLKEPSAAPNENEAPRIVTSLNLDGMRLERALELPRPLQKEVLAAWLGVNDVPVRIAFHLTTDDGARMQVAIATQRANADVWQVEQGMTNAVIAAWPTVANAVRVSVTSGAKDLVTVPPSGGDPLPEELPWVFEGRTDGRAKLLGTGSVRTAAQSVLVAIPHNGTIVPELEGNLQEIGTLHGCEWRIVRLEGTARWDVGDAHCVIRTNNSDSEDDVYMLGGQMVIIGFGARDVYQDHPPVMKYERGVRRTLAKSSLRWRSARHGAWRLWNEPGFGDIKIRVVEDGEVRFETRLTVFPKDFEIRSKVERTVGAFHIRCSRLDHAAVTMPDGTQLSSGRREGDGLICEGISVEPHEVPRVHLHLRFRDGGETTIPLAPPRPFMGFVRFDGSPVGNRVSLEDLPVLRARALTPEAAAKFDVEARRPDFGPITVARLPAKGDGFFELALDAVRPTLEALHVGDGLDDALELRVVKVGFVSPGHQRTLQVVARKDAFKPNRNEDGTVDVEIHVSVLATTSAPDSATLRVEARPIERYFEPNLKGPVLELTSIAPGRWRFDSGDEPFEPWLITAWQGGFCRLRPIRVKGRKESEPSDSPLVNAMRTGEHDKREELIVQVLRECAENGAHQDWDKLRAIIRTTTTLPSATFDAVRYMAQVPETAIVALALQRKPEERLLIWRALERLDFLWEMVPISAWVRAARSLLDWIGKRSEILEVEECTAAQYAARLMNALLDDVQKSDPIVDILREVFSKMLPISCAEPKVALAATPFGRAALLQCIEDASNELRVHHDGEEWPTSDIEALARTDERILDAFREVRSSFDLPSYARGIIDAPTLAAAAAATGASLTLEVRLELRRLRAFDRTWFQQCHAFQLALLLSSRMNILVG